MLPDPALKLKTAAVPAAELQRLIDRLR